ncbi:hypothetical protein ACFVAJ_17610 [Agromyces sp. NPDC057679]|uniref:hypothetical protein n=1 Tax=Agromyces sp. NPDC057679 TaxID=3346207 RepID=UPI00367015B9
MRGTPLGRRLWYKEPSGSSEGRFFVDWMWLLVAAVVIFFVVNGVMSSRQQKSDAEHLRQTRTRQSSEALESADGRAVQRLVSRYGRYDGSDAARTMTRNALRDLGTAAYAVLLEYSRNASSQEASDRFAAAADEQYMASSSSRVDAFADKIAREEGSSGYAVAAVVAETVSIQLSPEVVHLVAAADRSARRLSSGILEAVDPALHNLIHPSGQRDISTAERELKNARSRFAENVLLQASKTH